MANDKKETEETNGHDEIDEEIDFDDIAEHRSNKFEYLKKGLFVLFLAVIGFTVIWVGFKGGQKIFSIYKTTVEDSLQKNATNNKEMPNVAIVPKADGPAEEKIKSEVTQSVPVNKVEPASDQIEKVDNLVREKNIVQPTKIDVTPVPKAESSVAAAKPKITVPDVKPEAIASTVKPETKVSKPVAKKKAAAPKRARKHKEYKVIVGSFSIKANADSLISQLIVNKYEPMIVWAKTPNGQLYRVIAGSYRSLSEAKVKIDELEALGFQAFCIAE